MEPYFKTGEFGGGGGIGGGLSGVFGGIWSVSGWVSRSGLLHDGRKRREEERAVREN